MNIEKEKILEALRPIMMPSTSMDIVDAGGIRDIMIEDDAVHVEAVIFSPAMNMRRKTENQIIYLIEKLYPQARITVHVGSEKPADDKIAPVETSISHVKHIIAIASGKGGVGKSTLSANLAIALSRKGYRVGLVDADIYGPSMPIMFNVEDAMPVAVREGDKDMMAPIEAYGVKLQSIGFFAKAGQAMAWRGAMATKALQQMIFETVWGELDFLLIDMPPGTGDIHLTLTGALPLTGAIVITTPQNVALNDAQRGIELFRNDNINVPVIGIVENMSYFTPAELPENKYYIFGKHGGKNLAEDYGIPFLGEIPLVQSIREAADAGQPIALVDDSPLSKAFADVADSIVLYAEKSLQ
ncbi:MAG: P-loop NTPase [Flavobacteriales bacterium]|nr:P-loop NTPase [Flavobacteriales bacterium]MBQ5814532.1 P-loop NTPase [Flavobacteriales bacterium]